MTKRMVGDTLMKLAAAQAEAIMDKNTAIRESWLDQVRTSEASKSAGGVVALETEHDWVLAFFVWFHGGKLPREK